MSVSFDSAPRLRRSRSFGRATRPFRSLGMWSLVSRSGLPMAVPPREGSQAHGGTRRSRSSVLQSRVAPPCCVLTRHASRHTAKRRVRLTGRPVPYLRDSPRPPPPRAGPTSAQSVWARRTLPGGGARRRRDGEIRSGRGGKGRWVGKYLGQERVATQELAGHRDTLGSSGGDRDGRSPTSTKLKSSNSAAPAASRSESSPVTSICPRRRFAGGLARRRSTPVIEKD